MFGRRTRSMTGGKDAAQKVEKAAEKAEKAKEEVVKKADVELAVEDVVNY